MKYNAYLLESLKKDFPKYAIMNEAKILAYYKKDDFPELNFSVLIFEKDGRPCIATTKHNAEQIPFSLCVLNQHIKSLTAENEQLKRTLNASKQKLNS